MHSGDMIMQPCCSWLAAGYKNSSRILGEKLIIQIQTKISSDRTSSVVFSTCIHLNEK